MASGPVLEKYELFASLLWKAHEIATAFWVGRRLDWIIFWRCGRVKIRGHYLCPICNTRSMAGIRHGKEQNVSV